MAIPSGTGTECLRRGQAITLTNGATAFLFDGGNMTVGTNSATVPANHIITFISITFCETGNAAELMHLYLNDGTNNLQLLQDHPLAAYATFVWNTKFAMIGGDKLSTQMGSSADVDVYYTYLDQDWS